MATEPLLQAVDRACADLEKGLPAALADLRTRGGTIHCRQGCANCCHLAVHCTFPEAQRLAARLDRESAGNLDRYMARMLANLPRLGDFKDLLRHHRELLGACPFLDDASSCSVYAYRPLACRALLSTRPADWCGFDLSSLPDIERKLYLDSLDPQLVNYPTHYLAAPQQSAAAQEGELLQRMAQDYGFTLSGHLPTLAGLELRHKLSTLLSHGPAAVHDRIGVLSLDYPSLVRIQS